MLNHGEQGGNAAAHKNGDGALTVALIGHQGRMGGMLKAKWQSSGYEVLLLNCRNAGELDLKDLARARVVVLAVTITELCQAMELIGPQLRPDQLVMDITSVKTRPMQIMQEFHAGPVIGAHPLFGPLAPFNSDFKELNTALVQGHHVDEEQQRLAEELFKALGSGVFWATAEEHDRGVAYSQSLNFAVSAAFFSCIDKSADVTPYITPSFAHSLEAARSSLTDDAEIFCALTDNNPYFTKALKEMQGAINLVSSGKLADQAARAARWYE